MAEETVAPEEQPKTSPASSIMKLLLIVVLALVSSAFGGVSAWFLIMKTTKGVEAKAETVEKAVHDEHEAVRELLEKAAIVPIDPFVVNLADSESPRYLRITIKLMVDDKKKIEEIVTNQTLLAKIRDVILQTLTVKTSKDVIDEEGKNKLRQEILEKIGGYFKEPKLVDIMFTEFVIQL